MQGNIYISLFGSLPQGLRSALKSGTYPVEYDRLTDEAVNSSACRRLRFQMGVLIDPSNPNYESSQLTLPTEKWQQAARRNLDSLKVNFPDVYPIWKELYDLHMFGSNNPSKPWDERVFYDFKLRECAWPIGESKPRWNYQNLWDMARQECAARREEERDAARNERLNLEVARLSAKMGNIAVAGPSRPGGLNTTTKPIESRSSKPSEPETKSFRGKRQEFCFLCGSKEHVPEDCKARRTVEGYGLAAEANSDKTGQATVRKATTNAPSAEPPRMAPLPVVRPTPQWTAKTPLRIERWRHFLTKYHITHLHLDVLNGIEFGFSYRSGINIESTRIFEHLQSAKANPDVISQTINKEVEAGRYLGPFTKEQVEELLGPFLSHPLGVVRKDDSSKPRMIEDLSYPHDESIPSLNSLSDTSEFSVNWGGILEATRLVVEGKQGRQGATIDIEGAFRTIGIAPSEYWLGVVHWNGQFWIDTATKFGGKASGFIFEGPADLFCEILKRELPQSDNIRWVDDILLTRDPINNSPPFTYTYSVTDAIAIGNDLGFPFSRTDDFSFSTKYFGFLWHWDKKMVEVPEARRMRMLELVVLTKSRPKITMAALRSLCGKLSHIAQIILEGRVHMRALWTMLASMDVKGVHKEVAWLILESHQADLEWWEKKLSEPKIGMALCTNPIPDDSLGLFCDASTLFGIGIIIGGEYDAFRFLPGWQNYDDVSRGIGWAEAVSLELLVIFLFSSRKLRNHHFLVHTDNMGVIGAWEKRSSTNPLINEIIGRIIRSLISRQCFLSLKYIESTANPADAPSRGLAPPEKSRKEFTGFPRGYNKLIKRANVS